MPRNVFEKLLSDEINLSSIKIWMSNDDSKLENDEIQCSKASFITYFLNFLHANANPNKINQKSEKSSDVPKKLENRILDKSQCSSDLKKTKPRNRIKPTLVNQSVKSSIYQKRTNPNELFTSDKKLILNKNHIDIVIDLYCYLFEENFIVDVLGEIKYLVSFLSLTKTEIRNQNCGLFYTVENCEYFAINSLMQLLIHQNTYIDFLFDFKTFQFFNDNLFEKTFIRKQDRVRKYLNQKLKNCSTFTNNSNNVKQGSAVCHFDTDFNSFSNFPNSTTFSVFCKQRDFFFKIYEEWLSNKSKPDWNFESRLNKKIYALLSMTSESVNLLHFARFFTLYFLTVCQQSTLDTSNEDIFDNTENIKSRMDPDKFQKLQKRLTSQNNVYSEFEEFFFEFLKIAITNSSFLFILYLIDCLVLEIQEQISEFHQSTVLHSAHLKIDLNLFLKYLKVMKLLAKFLGCIDSSSGYDSNILAYKTFEKHKNLNFEKYRLSLDLITHLRSSRLILTIPWITTYLSMFQNATLFPNTLNELLSVYSSILSWETNRKTAFVLRLHLGQLFEKLHIHGQFFTKTKHSNSDNFDEIDTVFENFIDTKFLFENFPILYDIRKVIHSKSIISMKTIEPIKCSFADDYKPADVDLNLQLEESFLNMHPASFRKTIDFVSDRISSSCIKWIFSQIMPSIRLQMDTSIQKIFTTYSSDDNFSFNYALQLFESQSLPELTKAFTENSSKLIDEFLQNRLKTTIEALMPTDMTQSVINCCIKITDKRTRQKIQTWIQMQINDKNFLMKSFRESFKKYSNEALYLDVVDYEISQNMSLKTMDTFWAPSYILIELKQVLHKVYLNPDTFSENNYPFDNIFNQIVLSLSNRTDFGSNLLQRICMSLSELYFGIILKFPQLCSKELFEKLETICNVLKQKHRDKYDIFERIISKRNIFMLNNVNSSNTWFSFSSFIILLINSNLLTYQSFESQVLHVIENNNNKNNEVFTDELLTCVQLIIKELCKTNNTVTLENILATKSQL